MFRSLSGDVFILKLLNWLAVTSSEVSGRDRHAIVADLASPKLASGYRHDTVVSSPKASPRPQRASAQQPVHSNSNAAAAATIAQIVISSDVIDSTGLTREHHINIEAYLTVSGG